MRWKLLRRRLSVSAPRVIVRSHLPWPLRWAVLALVLGFCAALALAAFEFGQRIAGLDSGAHDELARLRAEVRQLREDYLGARAIADTAEVVLRAERAAQERLVEQLRRAEAEKHALQDDLAFFERLLPASGEGVQIRGLQVTGALPGLVRYQLLVVQLRPAATGAAPAPACRGHAGRAAAGRDKNGPRDADRRPRHHAGHADAEAVSTAIAPLPGGRPATQGVRP